MNTAASIPTPAVVIDVSTVHRNIDRLSAYCREHNLKLRPHTKTHKSLEIARLQLAGGASGLTVAKSGEAQVMSQVCDDLLIAYPAWDPSRARAIADVARGRTVRVAVDSTLAADRLGDAARSAGTVIGILVDHDVGFHRTGVQTPARAVEIGQHISRTQGLRLDGLFVYPGHVNDSMARDADALKPVAQTVRALLDAYKRAGLCADVVSGGSTPTAYQSHLVPGLTEIRPGTYVYNDTRTFTPGYCRIDDCAARVVCTVISDAVPGKVTIDAGSKTLTQEALTRHTSQGSFGHVVEHPDCTIIRLTEEHGEIDITKCTRPPRLGDRIHVIPNHVCPCINLHDSVWLKQTDGSLVRSPVDARGRVN